ncbi:MAG: type II toxin-antitoxin system YhaV family toxin [Gemmatimonadota bacterium]
MPSPHVVNGYHLLVWPAFDERWRNLRAAVERLREQDPDGYRQSPAAKLLAAVRDAALRDIPNDPGADRYRQGKTSGDANKHWRRDKFFRRFRLFFRYSSEAGLIAYVWLNDESNLRQSGARTDPYFIFRAMLERGRPPTDWSELVEECRKWTEADIESPLSDGKDS